MQKIAVIIIDKAGVKSLGVSGLYRRVIVKRENPNATKKPRKVSNPCKKYKKNKHPKCKDQIGCDWVKRKGCIQSIDK